MSLCNMNVKEQISSPKTGKRGLYTNNICFCYNIIDILVYLSAIKVVKTCQLQGKNHKRIAMLVSKKVRQDSKSS